VEDDFEATAVGEPPEGAHVSGESERTSIRVTDETAASGTHALKFTDAAGVEPTWQPHLYYAPYVMRGAVVGSYDLRLQPGALFRNEWRTGGHPYHVGPAITVDGAGVVNAGGEELLTIPRDAWVRVAIECTLGIQSTGTYNVAVTLPGHEPQRFEGLPFGSDRFRVFEWFGFISDANADVAFYLDNVKIVADSAM